MKKGSLYRFLLFAVSTAMLGYVWQDSVTHLWELVTTREYFAHGQLVPIVSVALIWSRRKELSLVSARYYLPAIIPLLIASLGWFLGSIFGVQLAGHIALILAVQSMILAIWGPSIFRAILFPVLFLFMLVPVGNDLVRYLQYTTADMVIWMLGALGVPYESEGVLITLSSGVYEVAAACAGIKFLFTSIFTGVLLAHLVFKSWKKRFAILVASVLIPVVANALRVLGILLIAEVTDQSFAKGVDHIVYGWGFLSVVLFLLIMVAYRFSDKPLSSSISPVADRSPVINGSYVQLLVSVCVISIPFGFTTLAPAHNTTAKHVETLLPVECGEKCSIRLLHQSIDSKRIQGEAASYSFRYRFGADIIDVSAALFCPVSPGNAGYTRHMLSNTENWTYQPTETRHFELYPKWDFEKRQYVLGNKRKSIFRTVYMMDKGIFNTRDLKIQTGLQRLRFGQAAAANLEFSVIEYQGADRPEKILTRFLSTFSPDKFLWDEIKPNTEGHNICVA